MRSKFLFAGECILFYVLLFAAFLLIERIILFIQSKKQRENTKDEAKAVLKTFFLVLMVLTVLCFAFLLFEVALPSGDTQVDKLSAVFIPIVSFVALLVLAGEAFLWWFFKKIVIRIKKKEASVIKCCAALCALILFGILSFFIVCKRHEKTAQVFQRTLGQSLFI